MECDLRQYTWETISSNWGHHITQSVLFSTVGTSESLEELYSVYLQPKPWMVTSTFRHPEGRRIGSIICRNVFPRTSQDKRLITDNSIQADLQSWGSVLQFDMDNNTDIYRTMQVSTPIQLVMSLCVHMNNVDQHLKFVWWLDLNTEMEKHLQLPYWLRRTFTYIPTY